MKLALALVVIAAAVVAVSAQSSAQDNDGGAKMKVYTYPRGMRHRHSPGLIAAVPSPRSLPPKPVYAQVKGEGARTPQGLHAHERDHVASQEPEYGVQPPAPLRNPTKARVIPGLVRPSGSAPARRARSQKKQQYVTAETYGEHNHLNRHDHIHDHMHDHIVFAKDFDGRTKALITEPEDEDADIRKGLPAYGSHLIPGKSELLYTHVDNHPRMRPSTRNAKVEAQDLAELYKAVDDHLRSYKN